MRDKNSDALTFSEPSIATGNLAVTALRKPLAARTRETYALAFAQRLVTATDLAAAR